MFVISILLLKIEISLIYLICYYEVTLEWNRLYELRESH